MAKNLFGVELGIAVTNERIIVKRGLISRRTNEMNMAKVESVDVDQSVLGRLLGYGTILVRGTGAGLNPIRNIDMPLEFRRAIALTATSPRHRAL